MYIVKTNKYIVYKMYYVKWAPLVNYFSKRLKNQSPKKKKFSANKFIRELGLKYIKIGGMELKFISLYVIFVLNKSFAIISKLEVLLLSLAKLGGKKS